MVIALIWSGRAEEALPWIDNALEHESGRMLADLCQKKCYANMLLGRYEAAVPACEKSAALSGDWPNVPLFDSRIRPTGSGRKGNLGQGATAQADHTAD
jgi:hypothetical protein